MESEQIIKYRHEFIHRYVQLSGITTEAPGGQDADPEHIKNDVLIRLTQATVTPSTLSRIESVR